VQCVGVEDGAAMEEERLTLDEAIAALRDEGHHTSKYVNAQTFEEKRLAVTEFVSLALEEAIAFLSRTISDTTEEVRTLSCRGGPLADRGGRNLMLAVGLIEGPPDPVYRHQKLLVLPEDADVEDLKQTRAVLRVALRTHYWAPPPESVARLAPRLYHASHDELVELVAAVAIRDREALAAAEQELARHPSTCAWSTLPDLAITTIATKLNGLAGLRWCTVCRAFRAVQPPVRILSIGGRLSARDLDDEYSVDDLEDGGIGGIALEFADEYNTHRLIESISARHAAELTHLYIHVVDTRGDMAQPLRDHLDQPHGAHLTALRVLDVVHPAAGNTGVDCQPHTLANYASELVRSVSGTLRDLSICAPIRFTVDDLIALLPHVGPQLHHLRARLIPFSIFGVSRGSGDPAETQRLRDAVQLHCTSLRSEAQVCCHVAPRFPGLG